MPFSLEERPVNWTPAWQARGSDRLTPQLGVTKPEFPKEQVSWLGQNLTGKVGAIVREVLAQGTRHPLISHCVGVLGPVIDG